MDPPYPLVREPVGWGRLKAQFEKIIPLLTDDGFAVLRTPAPLFHEFNDAGEVQIQPDDEGVHEKRRKERGGGKRRDAARWLNEDEIADAMDKRGASGEADPFDDDEPKAEPPPIPAPAAPKAPEMRQELVDLKMAGAVGPETHVYHGMAVHLYMKAGAQMATAPNGQMAKWRQPQPHLSSRCAASIPITAISPRSRASTSTSARASSWR